MCHLISKFIEYLSQNISLQAHKGNFQKQVFRIKDRFFPVNLHNII